MAATFLGASEASKTAGDTEIEKLHAKIGQLLVERDFLIELARVERTIGQLLDRVVDTDSRTIGKTYQSRIATLEEEKALIAERVAQCGRPLKGFDDTLRTAMPFSQTLVNYVIPTLGDKACSRAADIWRESDICARREI